MNCWGRNKIKRQWHTRLWVCWAWQLPQLQFRPILPPAGQDKDISISQRSHVYRFGASSLFLWIERSLRHHHMRRTWASFAAVTWYSFFTSAFWSYYMCIFWNSQGALYSVHSELWYCNLFWLAFHNKQFPSPILFVFFVVVLSTDFEASSIYTCFNCAFPLFSLIQIWGAPYVFILSPKTRSQTAQIILYKQENFTLHTHVPSKVHTL